MQKTEKPERSDERVFVFFSERQVPKEVHFSRMAHAPVSYSQYGSSYTS